MDEKYKFSKIEDDGQLPKIISIDERPANLGKRGELKVVLIDMPDDRLQECHAYTPQPCTAVIPDQETPKERLIRQHPFFRRLINKLFPLFLCLCLSSCFGFRPEAIIAHPDSPFLIQEVKGHYAHVLIYDKTKNKLIDYGWVDMKLKFQGYTLSKYNWEKLINKRAANAP